MENEAIGGIAVFLFCKYGYKLAHGQIEKKNGGAIEHYSQNETAHFNRNHKADEPLSFDRGNIQHHIPNKLLMGRQLAETIEEAKVRKLEEREQLEKHPQDRDVKDQEVNEQPNGDEQDYKEH
ncbi:unnamed protein product [Caenorhabditis sp. 36 PRJEB53466]|nr:unnamed protein product [Caenorhabditis sp. 36 PRJEB53466]